MSSKQDVAGVRGQALSFDQLRSSPTADRGPIRPPRHNHTQEMADCFEWRRHVLQLAKKNAHVDDVDDALLQEHTDSHMVVPLLGLAS